MKKKIAFTFPHMHNFGGGEVFCEYIINFLCKKYQVDLYFYKNNYINKNLKINSKVNIYPLKSENFFFDFFFRRYIFLAQLYIIFALKDKNYNLVFSGAGEFAHRSRCIQYIHHPFYSLNPKHYFALGLKKSNLFKILQRLIISLFARVFLYLKRSYFYKNLTLTNSNFIRKRILKIYPKLNSKILYPTFKIVKNLKIHSVNYEKRKNDFVILGRVSKDKNTLKALNFFKNLKKKNPESKIGKLHIIGPIDKNLKKKLFKIIKKEKDCRFYEYLELKKRDKILKKSKYGLHFCIEEHFGRSVLEMQKNGLIVFCHNSGGAMEIIGNSWQKYFHLHELENKIIKVMSSIRLREKIRIDINKKIKRYNDEYFKKKLELIIQNEI